MGLDGGGHFAQEIGLQDFVAWIARKLLDGNGRGPSTDGPIVGG